MLQRIWKYKFHYVIVIPALLLVIFFKVVPLVRGLQLPFQHFDLFQAAGEKTWVGFANLSALFARPEFLQVLRNSLTYTLFPMIIVSLLALLLALALHAIPIRRWRNVLTTLLLVPYFLPIAVLAYVVMLLFSANSPWLTTERLWLGDSELFPMLVIGVEVVRMLGIPILIAMAAIAAKSALLDRESEEEQLRQGYAGRCLLPAMQAIGAFALIQLSTLSAPNFELLYSLYNPLVYETADTLGTYQFRTGLQMADFGTSGTVWFVQFVIQLVCAILAYLLLRSLLKPALFAGKQPAAPPDRPASPGAMLGVLVGAVAVLPAVFLLYLLIIYPLTQSSGTEVTVLQLLPMRTMLTYALIYLISTVVFMLMTVTLAYPLTVRRLPGRWAYKLFLLVMIVAGTMTIPEFLMYRNMGMLNTVFPIAIQGFFSLLSVFVLKSIFNSKHGDRKAQLEAEGSGESHAFFTLFLPKVWKPLLALGALHWIGLWNGYASPLIYLSDASRFPPVMRFVTLMRGAGGDRLAFDDPVVMSAAAMLTLPALILLVLLRRWLTSEVLVSQGRGS
ncbi:hypothetical protein [Paenibacillus sp. 1P07SE]|uniref:hypothetical protein n=1 Tax=Paenibacillus sp. 1P07SE TaxID=3132209 RepID=UPI0039A742BD